MSAPRTNPIPPAARPSISMAKSADGASTDARCRNSAASWRVYGWGNRSRSCLATRGLFACAARDSASSRRHERTMHRSPRSCMQSEQRAPFAAEPSLRFAERGARGLDQPPEAARVILLAQVHQLVDEDVIANGVRRLHQPEVQGDDALARARSPSRSLVANRDAGDLQAVRLRQFLQARNELALRNSPQACLCGRSQIDGDLAQPATFVPEHQPV